MAQHKLSLRTLGIIEHMYDRGISVVSIAGATQVREDRVRRVIERLEAERSEHGKRVA